MKPGREEDRRFPRDVRQILDRGITWGDNIGHVVTFKWNSNDTPSRVTSPVSTQPLAVIPLRAVLRDPKGEGAATNIVTPGSLVWRWISGTIEVYGVSGTSTGKDYDMTVGLLMG